MEHPEEMQALLRAETAQVSATIAATAESVGACFFCHFRPFDRSSAEFPQIITNFPERWVRGQLDNKRFRNDPVLRTSLASNLLSWWRKDDDLGLDPAASRVIAERFAQGCSIGVSIPVRGRSGQFSVLSLWSDDERRFVDGVSRGFDRLHTFALYLHDRLFREGANGHCLSEIELECLKWTSFGKTAWEISVLLSLPERTVHYHLAEASKKLGAPNKTAAVCTALKAGLMA